MYWQWCTDHKHRTVGNPSLPAFLLSKLLYTGRPAEGLEGRNKAAGCQLSGPKPMLRRGCNGLVGLLKSAALGTGHALGAARSLEELCAVP